MHPLLSIVRPSPVDASSVEGFTDSHITIVDSWVAIITQMVLGERGRDLVKVM